VLIGEASHGTHDLCRERAVNTRRLIQEKQFNGVTLKETSPTLTACITSSRTILNSSHLERAIGVIYLPRSERVSHYFRCCLPEQFDALIHLDRTRSIVPFERTKEWTAGELPETYAYAV
jgi:erythromycin esterase-like protein